ncbi:HAMP domain-containing histidine kinase [Staphylococcus lugdunensis]|uniref:sensor histidine kinase n=1 Tax=Staphylococcus lugdunensis TaxID=28035 RepID=UPI001F4CDC87|nr:HAMP domain-containing sensor histidine kinase [Staphylococcus lugdunensis]MCH8646589.1 HAMP domain-containing histidine kinase [Staphylococcus lugdunensis]
MFKSLYSRIAIYTITVILLSAILSFFISNVYYHFNLKPKNDQKIMTTLKNARQFDAAQQHQVSSSFFKHLADMNYQIMTVDKYGHKHFYGADFRKDTLSATNIQRVLQGHDYHGIAKQHFQLLVTGFFDNETDNTVGVRFKSSEGYVAVFMRPDIGQTFSEFRIFLALLIILLLIISISLIIASTYAIIKPIQSLKYATERLMHGDFDTPIKQTRTDEIGILQYRFDTMRQSLKQVDAMRQHFVQNVSHEMKTPLTHIHHALTQLQASDDKATQQTIINDLFTITSRLSDLTRELLILSELDNASHIQLNSTIQLDLLLQDLIRHEQYLIERKNIIVYAELLPSSLLGNERLLHQAFENLLRNAIKYTNNEGAINIKLQHRNNHVHFTIQNDGQPMTKEAQLHIFDRFYKVNSNDTSNGLGLSITQAIVQLHHGHIEVESNNLIGTQFTVILPFKP